MEEVIKWMDWPECKDKLLHAELYLVKFHGYAAEEGGVMNPGNEVTASRWNSNMKCFIQDDNVYPGTPSIIAVAELPTGKEG